MGATHQKKYNIQNLQSLMANNVYGLSNKLFKTNCYTKRDQDLAVAAYCGAKSFSWRLFSLLYL